MLVQRITACDLLRGKKQKLNSVKMFLDRNVEICSIQIQQTPIPVFLLRNDPASNNQRDRRVFTEITWWF